MKKKLRHPHLFIQEEIKTQRKLDYDRVCERLYNYGRHPDGRRLSFKDCGAIMGITGTAFRLHVSRAVRFREQGRKTPMEHMYSEDLAKEAVKYLAHAMLHGPIRSPYWHKPEPVGEPQWWETPARSKEYFH